MNAATEGAPMSNAITEDAAATEGCAAVAGYARTCRDCAHCADIHTQTELIYCEEREKNKHPNYAARCESFVRHTHKLTHAANDLRFNN